MQTMTLKLSVHLLRFDRFLEPFCRKIENMENLVEVKLIASEGHTRNSIFLIIKPTKKLVHLDMQ